MITVIVIDFMGLYGENHTEFGKNSSHVCLHACNVKKSKMDAVRNTETNTCVYTYIYISRELKIYLRRN